MKFRKKPVVIETVQYNYNNLDEVCQFTDGYIAYIKSSDTLLIETLEVRLNISVGDFVIKGVKGELYHCKPDIFEITYEFPEEKK
jgi:hypothetical protein